MKNSLLRNRKMELYALLEAWLPSAQEERGRLIRAVRAEVGGSDGEGQG